MEVHDSNYYISKSRVPTKDAVGYMLQTFDEPVFCGVGITPNSSTYYINSIFRVDNLYQPGLFEGAVINSGTAFLYGHQTKHDDSDLYKCTDHMIATRTGGSGNGVFVPGWTSYYKYIMRVNSSTLLGLYGNSTANKGSWSTDEGEHWTEFSFPYANGAGSQSWLSCVYAGNNYIFFKCAGGPSDPVIYMTPSLTSPVWTSFSRITSLPSVWPIAIYHAALNIIVLRDD